MTRLPHGAEVRTPDGTGRIQEIETDGYRVMFEMAKYHGEIPEKFHKDTSPTISKSYREDEVRKA